MKDQRLLVASRQLDDAKTLAECGVQDGSTVHLLLRLRGGSPLDEAARKVSDMDEAVFDLYTRVCAWCEQESAPSKELGDSEKNVRGFKDELVKEQERLDCLVVSADERAVRKALHSKFDDIYELLEETTSVLCELKTKVKILMFGVYNFYRSLFFGIKKHVI